MQLFAADELSRRQFSDAFFLGALRVKSTNYNKNCLLKCLRSLFDRQCGPRSDTVCLFCLDALCPSHQVFSSDGKTSGLPGLNQY